MAVCKVLNKAHYTRHKHSKPHCLAHQADLHLKHGHVFSKYKVESKQPSDRYFNHRWQTSKLENIIWKMDTNHKWHRSKQPPLTEF